MLYVDKVYKKDHKENVKLFRDLKSHKKYSVYATELNRVFGDKSYDIFYNDLLYKKKMHINNFTKMFEKPVVKGGLKKYEEPFNIKVFNDCLKSMKIKNEELEYRIKHPHILNSSSYRQYKEEMLKLKKEKNLDDSIILPDKPDIGRYNPNYDSIRTHSYYPTFASTDFHNFNKINNNNAHRLSLGKKDDNEPVDKNKNKNKYETRNKRSRLVSGKFNIESNNISSINDKSQSNMKNTDFNISQYMSTSSFGDEKNNHCLKFDSYSTRKPMVIETNYNSDINNPITNYNPIRNVKGNVDFNKISSNSHILSYFDEIAKNNNNPPLGMYRPNYDYIEKKPVNIYLSKRDPPSPRLAQLKKIIYSYNISSDYKMVSTLNNYNKPKFRFDSHN